MHAPFLHSCKFDRVTNSKVFPAENNVSNTLYGLLAKRRDCDYKTSTMNRKTRRKLNPEDEYPSSTNAEGRPSSAIPVTKELKLHPFEHHPFFQGILIYLIIFLLRRRFTYTLNSNNSFWILLQAHLLIYCKWIFSFLHKLIFLYECFLCS